MNKETKLQNEIMEAVSPYCVLVLRQQSGLFYNKMGVPVRIGLVGLPDLLCILKNGEAIFLEVKEHEKAHRRPEQIKMVNFLQGNGVIAKFVWSVEQAVYIVKEMGRY